VVGHITTPGFAISSSYGTLQVEQGGMELAPKDFTHTVVVPGLRLHVEL